MRIDHIVFRMRKLLGARLTLFAIHFLASLRPFVGLQSLGGWEEKVWLVNQVPSRQASILDIGSSESITRLLLPKTCDVLGLDVRFLRGMDSRDAVVGDAMAMPFRAATFDFVLLSSTIEHIGMGAYGDANENRGDILAAREATRVLKPGGRLIMTTPFSTEGGSTWQRFYSEEMLDTLTQGLKLLKKEYLLKGKGFRQVWKKVESKELPFVPAADPLQAIACLIAQRYPEA